ncbi:hypothetical protein Poly24_47510 [Rosistilla carotiformis]|uniref:Uncharacterized protein n=1 Tax=Rosistilla carotiformis TaxID=2528017 RepID=A0A518JZP6_9BACT|nr:hypothetical protein Poly24_47510 [Rosistilla carotiformis]
MKALAEASGTPFRPFSSHNLINQHNRSASCGRDVPLAPSQACDRYYGEDLFVSFIGALL